MVGGVEVFGGVAVGALVAAAYVAAGEAGAEVDPLGVGLHALFAACGVGVVRLGGGEVFAESGHVLWMLNGVDEGKHSFFFVCRGGC